MPAVRLADGELNYLSQTRPARDADFREQVAVSER